MTKNIKFLTTTALMTAVICILGPLSIPIGPIPISLGTLAIYLTMYVLDKNRGTLAVLIYLLLGLVGLPVFSGFTGGAGKLFGPTGGFLIGYIPMAFLIGLALEKFWKKRIISVLLIEVATWVLYMFGTIWLMIQANLTFKAALASAVIPFIVLDLAKIIIAAIVGPVLKKRLSFFNEQVSVQHTEG